MDKEQEYEPTQGYIKGFNEGYTIAKHLPDVADNLSDVLGNSERAQGFQQGRMEYVMEKQKDKECYPDWLKDDYQVNKEDIEIDKEDIEPEL